MTEPVPPVNEAAPDGMARREIRFLLENRTHIDMGNVHRIMARYEAEVAQPYIKALRAVTSYTDSAGCPGEEAYGRGHTDVGHVAPYHCANDGGCVICNTLNRSRVTPDD